MNHWLTTKNNRSVRKSDIPLLTQDVWRQECLAQIQTGKRPLLMMGIKEADHIQICTFIADDELSQIKISSTSLALSHPRYSSLSAEAPAFSVFERELHEELGIMPFNHPWLKPLRYPFNRHDPSQKFLEYPFFKMKGEGVHEVGVGPVHAGIIEPGHFRFMCHGELVYHLEIQLGYQHRGVEALFSQKKPGFLIHLAESIAGDSLIAHASAYANAVEGMAEMDLTNKAMTLRAVALEMERIAMHLSDLGALCNDVAYLLGSAVFGATRTLVINSLLALCGSRFGKGLIRLGGVAFVMNAPLKEQFRKTLKKVDEDTVRMCEALFDLPSALARFEYTGIVSSETAQAIGLVGMAARASGIPMDVRSDHPFGIYQYFPMFKNTLKNGDVFSRAYLRYLEIRQSIKFIREQLDNFHEADRPMVPLKPLCPDELIISMVEGWRGEVVHCLLTDKEGKIRQYKIKDPSFQNWYGLALAVRDNEISDFPICNKSFNLSYCGHDL